MSGQQGRCSIPGLVTDGDPFARFVTQRCPHGNRKRRGSKGGHPVSYHTEAYKRRNVVEGPFNVFKQWRALATRYDKLALTYRGGVVLRAITIWLKALGDTP